MKTWARIFGIFLIISQVMIINPYASTASSATNSQCPSFEPSVCNALSLPGVTFNILEHFNRIGQIARLNFIRLLNIRVRWQTPIRIVELASPEGKFSKFPIFSNPFIIFSKSNDSLSGSIRVEKSVDLQKPHWILKNLGSVFVTGEAMADIFGQYSSQPFGIVTATSKGLPKKMVLLDSAYRLQPSVIAQLKSISSPRDGPRRADYEIIQAPSKPGFIGFWFVDMRLATALMSIDPLIQQMADRTIESLAEGFQTSLWWREFWGDDLGDTPHARSEDGIQRFKAGQHLEVVRLFMDFLFQKATFTDVVQSLRMRRLDPQWFAVAVRGLPSKLSSLDKESNALAIKLSASA